MSKSFIQKIAALIAVVFVGISAMSGCKKGGEESEEVNLPELVIGVDYYAPVVYHDDDGNFVGLDVELAEKVCEIIGYKPRFVRINWGMKNAALKNDEINCIWCCFTMTGRESEYDWTEPYMNVRQVVAVKEDSDIGSIDDLNDKRIAVQSSTKPDDVLSGRAGVRMTVPKLKSLNCFTDISYMFAAINEGYVDAVAGHELVLREYMKTSFVKLRILPEALLDGQVGVAFLKRTHPETIKRINQAFYLLKHNGYMANLVSSYRLDPNDYVVDYGKTK